jgi:hypothetical protein
MKRRKCNEAARPRADPQASHGPGAAWHDGCVELLEPHEEAGNIPALRQPSVGTAAGDSAAHLVADHSSDSWRHGTALAGCGARSAGRLEAASGVGLLTRVARNRKVEDHGETRS